MRGYEEAIEMHREVLDMGARERAEHRVLTAFVARYGEQIVARPNFSNPPVVIMLRVLAEVNPVLAVNTFDDEQWEVFKREAQRLLDNPAAYAKRITRAAISRLAESETVWASPSLVERAQQVDPHDVVVPDRQSLPFERAFVMLGEPVRTAGELLWEIEAVSWDVLTDDRIVARTYGRLHEEGHPLDGTLQPDMIGLQEFGKPMLLDSAAIDAGPDTDVHGALTYRIMSLLAREVDDEDADDVRIAVTDASGDKDAKRAAKKAGIKPEINVIYAAREKTRVLGSGTGTGKGKGGTRRHRVRAHWRHQPYGPERALRRWVLVSEHERGKKGELDERDRVYRA